MTLTVQFIPNMSTNHKFQKHTGVIDIQIGVGSRCICIRFFPHWVKALAPEDIDSLTHCRAVRHAPVLRPRSPLDGHLSQLQTHRGFIRAILLLHDSGNQWNLTSSTILIHIGYIMQWIAVCRVLNLARMLSCHNMNPKNQSILDSLTTLDILLINRIDALELMS